VSDSHVEAVASNGPTSKRSGYGFIENAPVEPAQGHIAGTD